MKLKRTLMCLLLAALLLVPSLLSSCAGTKYEVVMEYNGMKLTEDMYYYWVATFKRNILTSYSDARDTEEFWGQKYDEERTVGEYFDDVVRARIMDYLIAQDLYKKNRLLIGDDVRKEIKEDIKEKIDYYGSRGALNAELAELMLNVNSLEDVYTWEAKHDCVYNALFGEGGSHEVSDEILVKYYEETYSLIRYIVIYTTKIKTDADGEYVYDSMGNLITEELTEEEMAEKKAAIDSCYDKLQKGEDFETLRKEYSEFDTSSYPNGFFVSSNELDIWGADIVLAVQDAKAGDVMKVEEGEAVFLIEKLPLPAMGSLGETDLKQLANLASYATKEYYDALFAELRKSVTINQEVMNKYKLPNVKANPFYSI
ncbi:MAG: peptidylprolyl isomerase [Clostridia bacterium]|nr:peptidylprolyl isomerase [Clostridia bacterium]